MAAVFALVVLGASTVQAQDAAALRARHAALGEALLHSPFGRPLYIQSSARSGEQAGEVYAILDKPFATVAPALESARQWCDILVLPPNVKRCEPSGEALALFVVRRPRDALEEAYRVDLAYRVIAHADDYAHVALRAADGPFGTSDYRIGVELAPLEARRTFLRLSYSYRLGLAARLALQAYLATAGRDKVGFSVVRRQADGRAVYVDGMRGVVERNAMRYYLAIQAHLDALDAPGAERLEARLNAWYAGIERYPRQLAEDLRRDEYLRMKLAETRSDTGAAASGATR